MYVNKIVIYGLLCIVRAIIICVVKQQSLKSFENENAHDTIYNIVKNLVCIPFAFHNILYIKYLENANPLNFQL